MANTSDIRNGLCIEHNNDLYIIVEFQHVNPGKGAAFVRTKLKSLTKGKVLEHTFNSGIKITIARIEKRLYQFLYKNGITYHFMDNQSFDQIELGESFINTPQFLKEGQQVEIITHQDTGVLLSCELPPVVELQVTYTEPGFKGNTVTRSLKSATLETGVEVKVPLFIKNGDRLKIDTRKGIYTERCKL